VPLPWLVLTAPLLAAQFARGTPLALLADPGVAVPATPPTGWQLLLGSPSAGGWPALIDTLELPGHLASPAAIALFAPLAAVVLLALFLPGAGRAIPATLLALGGLLTAVAAAHLAPAAAGAHSVGIWPGSGLSLYWAGLLGAVAIALGALRRVAVVVGTAVLLSAAVAVAPSLVTLATGGGAVVPGDGRVAPAIVVAESIADPGLGTLVLRPQIDGSLAATVDRGAGATLDRTSTFAATRPSPSAAQRELAELAGNLASRGGYDPAPVLARLGIEFVVLTPSEGPSATAIRERAAEALDAQAALEVVGDTARGSLWRFGAYEPIEPPSSGPGLGAVALGGQLAVFGFAVLLALPTGRRRRLATASDEHDDAGDVFDADGFETDGFDEEHRG